MAEKHTKAEEAIRRAERLDNRADAKPDPTFEQRREGPIRAAEDRRKANIPPPPGSPVRSGLDRRKGDRRGR